MLRSLGRIFHLPGEIYSSKFCGHFHQQGVWWYDILFVKGARLNKNYNIGNDINIIVLMRNDENVFVENERISMSKWNKITSHLPGVLVFRQSPSNGHLYGPRNHEVPTKRPLLV